MKQQMVTLFYMQTSSMCVCRQGAAPLENYFMFPGRFVLKISASYIVTFSAVLHINQFYVIQFYVYQLNDQIRKLSRKF